MESLLQLFYANIPFVILAILYVSILTAIRVYEQPKDSSVLLSVDANLLSVDEHLSMIDSTISMIESSLSSNLANIHVSQEPYFFSANLPGVFLDTHFVGTYNKATPNHAKGDVVYLPHNYAYSHTSYTGSSTFFVCISTENVPPHAYGCNDDYGPGPWAEGGGSWVEAQTTMF